MGCGCWLTGLDISMSFCINLFIDSGCGYIDFLYSIKEEVATANGIEHSIQRLSTENA